MKNYIIGESERNQIINTLEGLVISANQGAVLVQIATFLKALQATETNVKAEKEELPTKGDNFAVRGKVEMLGTRDEESPLMATTL